MKKPIRLFLFVLILSFAATGCSLIENFTGGGKSDDNTAAQSGTDTVITAPIVQVPITGHTEKEQKYYENEFFGMGCSLDDSWTIEKVQYNYYQDHIADMLGLQNGPDGSIPLMNGYNLDFYATRPGEVILVYVKDKNNTFYSFDSEADFLIKNKIAESGSDVENITFLGKTHASKLVKSEQEGLEFHRFIVIETEGQYMVVDIVAAFQDSTGDLQNYFYIPGKTTVPEEIKHPADDGSIVAMVLGAHGYFNVTASTTHSAKGYKFSADNLSDGDVMTAWCGDANTGDTITYEFNDVVEFRGLTFVNGNLKDESSYNAYGKITKMRIDYDGGFFEAPVELVSYSEVVNRGRLYMLDFQKLIKTKTLKLTILETTAGASNDLPSISEIMLNVKMKAYIVRESTGEKFYLGTNSISIGKDESNTIVIDNDKLNDKEVSICYKNSEVYAMGGLNPKDTKVDGVAIYGTNKYSLIDGSVIKVGKEKFTFGVESP